MTSIALSQEGKDYLIKLSKDTVFTKIVRIDKKKKSVICEYNGKKIKYEAKDILELKFDTVIYETGLVRLKRSNQLVFLRRTIKGKLCLYETDIKTKEILWKNIGEDFVHFRWVYRAQKWAQRNYITVYFYKKEYEPRESYSKSWKEKTQDCKLLLDKSKSKIDPQNPTPRELTQFYNTNCK